MARKKNNEGFRGGPVPKKEVAVEKNFSYDLPTKVLPTEDNRGGKDRVKGGRG